MSVWEKVWGTYVNRDVSTLQEDMTAAVAWMVLNLLATHNVKVPSYGIVGERVKQVSPTLIHSSEGLHIFCTLVSLQPNIHKTTLPLKMHYVNYLLRSSTRL